MRRFAIFRNWHPKRPTPKSPWCALTCYYWNYGGGRSALYDAELAAILEVRYALPELVTLIAKASAKGKSGDALYKQVIEDTAKMNMPHFPEKVGGCFIAGTLVHTDQGMKPIEQIRIGDRVLSQPEGGGERVYKQVVNTFNYDDKEIWVVKYTLVAEDYLKGKKPIHHLYATANHPFWVEGLGWTTAEELSADQQLQLADGGIAIVQQVWPVWRTPVAGLGWVRTDILGMPDATEAHIVDFRGGCDLWAYPLFRKHEAVVPLSGLGNVDTTIFDHAEMCNIYERADRNFKTRVYSLEVEDCHTYYVGEEGVWVHNRNC